MQRATNEDDDLGDHGEHREGDQMPPQGQAVELMCLCDDVPDDGVELRILKGLLTAATSSTLHLHGQVCFPHNAHLHPSHGPVAFLAWIRVIQDCLPLPGFSDYQFCLE